MRPSFPSLFKFLTGFVLLAPSMAGAAACCGGGFAAPALIAGDDRAQLTTSYSRTQVIVDQVDNQGLWRQWDQHSSTQRFQMDGALVLSDRWQIGASLPIVQRTRTGQEFSGLGDVAGSLGYEFLTDWDYHPYRPKGLIALQVTLPTGKSKGESENGGLDSTGNGFWAVGTTVLLTKTFSRWDVLTSLEAHHSFEKSVRNSQIQGILLPGNGSNLGIGAGYNTADFRFGGNLTWTSEEAVRTTGTLQTSGAAERYATAVLSVSYLASDEWAGTFNYSDQSLFGDPANTSLGRGFALVLQRRWSR